MVVSRRDGPHEPRPTHLKRLRGWRQRLCDLIFDRQAPFAKRRLMILRDRLDVRLGQMDFVVHPIIVGELLR